MTKPAIYEQHDAAFGNVTAAVVLKDGERVATIAIKHGNAATAFVHWIGNEMAKGRATGYGYDKSTAACAIAAEAYLKAERKAAEAIGAAPRPDRDGDKLAFWTALTRDDGRRWDSQLEQAGFTVLHAIS